MGDIYDAVGRDAYNAVSDGDADLTVVVNGDTVSSPDLDDYIVRSSTSDAEGTGRGILTESSWTTTTHHHHPDLDLRGPGGRRLRHRRRRAGPGHLEGAEFDADDYT